MNFKMPFAHLCWLQANNRLHFLSRNTSLWQEKMLWYYSRINDSQFAEIESVLVEREKGTRWNVDRYNSHHVIRKETLFLKACEESVVAFADFTRRPLRRCTRQEWRFSATTPAAREPSDKFTWCSPKTSVARRQEKGEKSRRKGKEGEEGS